MNNPLVTIHALAVITAKRIRSQIDLTSALFMGLIAALSLVVCVPLYADAVFNRMLREGIVQTATTGEVMTRPTFGFLFNVSGAVNGNLHWPDVQPLESYLSGPAGSDVGLPFKSLVSFVQTDPAAISRPGNRDEEHQGSLVWASLGFASGLSEHITLVEGRAPVDASPRVDSQVEVLASRAMATRTGLRTGESYLASVPKTDPNGRTRDYQVPVIITGLWEPADPQDEYWFLPPSVLENSLLLTKTTFVQRISSLIPDEVYSGYWYLVLDGSQVRADRVPSLFGGITRMESNGQRLLRSVRIDWSPRSALLSFSQAAGRLAILLYAFSIPIGGLILAFLLLVSGLSVNRQRREIAILRSRGVSASAILIMMAAESLILGLAALAASLPIGMLAAGLIGHTRSFMTFFADSDVQVILSRTAVTSGLAAVGVVVCANLAPGFSAIQKTIVSYRQQRARQSRLPWWQRAGLDFLLLIPAAYSIFLLRQPGTLAGRDPFNNPLLFLAPALAILALTLLLLRLISPLMAGIARLTSFTRWVGLTMAARYLSRNPGSFNTPLVILVLTLSLSAYTSSIAQTLDLHLYDQTYYRVGTDVRFVESGRRSTGGDKNKYYFTPVADYLRVKGVNAASRVGVYPTGIEANVGGMISGRFMGIDRSAFSQVAFWRADFAPGSLEGLMDALARRPDGILASSRFLAAYGFQVGDDVQLVVTTFERSSRLDFRIVGAFDLFPTWYPSEGPLFVGNLDNLFDRIGETYPYQVWLRTAPNIDQTLPAELLSVNSALSSLESAPLDMAKAQKRPERQGALGLLFLGFAAAALLTVLGFLLYVVFSFRQRFVELGVLRATGLSTGQMAAYIASELASLILLGGLAGTAFGIGICRLFIPYLQIGIAAADQVPPFVVLIAWPAISQIYTLFGGLFVVTLVILIFSLWHIKIFQAIKLGETV